MCHLILLMPIAGLGVFWLFPFAVAVPIYLVILSVSGVVYYVAMRAMHRSVQTGGEAMAHKIGEVVDARTGHGRVEVEGEVWRALSVEQLHKGERVEVLGVTDRLTLRVRKLTAGRCL